jgi:hypothetical protein
MIGEQLRSYHRVHIGSGWNEDHLLGELFHNYHHRVMIHFGRGQKDVKVHTHLFKVCGRNF